MPEETIEFKRQVSEDGKLEIIRQCVILQEGLGRPDESKWPTAAELAEEVVTMAKIIEGFVLRN